VAVAVGEELDSEEVGAGVDPALSVGTHALRETRANAARAAVEEIRSTGRRMATILTCSL